MDKHGSCRFFRRSTSARRSQSRNGDLISDAINDFKRSIIIKEAIRKLFIRLRFYPEIRKGLR